MIFNLEGKINVWLTHVSADTAGTIGYFKHQNCYLWIRDWYWLSNKSQCDDSVNQKLFYFRCFLLMLFCHSILIFHVLFSVNSLSAFIKRHSIFPKETNKKQKKPPSSQDLKKDKLSLFIIKLSTFLNFHTLSWHRMLCKTMTSLEEGSLPKKHSDEQFIFLLRNNWCNLRQPYVKTYGRCGRSLASSSVGRLGDKKKKSHLRRLQPEESLQVPMKRVWTAVLVWKQATPSALSKCINNPR